MKIRTQIYILLLRFAFCTPCKGQNKTELPKGSIKSETEAVIASLGPITITRAIKQDKRGNIWIATFQGVERRFYH
jgi:hypothetical protein